MVQITRRGWSGHLKSNRGGLELFTTPTGVVLNGSDPKREVLDGPDYSREVLDCQDENEEVLDGSDPLGGGPERPRCTRGGLNG